MKQNLKTFFSKTSCFVFLVHSQELFLGRSLLRNQEKGAKGASAPFSEVI